MATKPEVRFNLLSTVDCELLTTDNGPRLTHLNLKRYSFPLRVDAANQLI